MRSVVAQCWEFAKNFLAETDKRGAETKSHTIGQKIARHLFKVRPTTKYSIILITSFWYKICKITAKFEDGDVIKIQLFFDKDISET